VGKKVWVLRVERGVRGEAKGCAGVLITLPDHTDQASLTAMYAPLLAGLVRECAADTHVCLCTCHVVQNTHALVEAVRQLSTTFEAATAFVLHRCSGLTIVTGANRLCSYVLLLLCGPSRRPSSASEREITRVSSTFRVHQHTNLQDQKARPVCRQLQYLYDLYSSCS
jgi:hypothetical protein